MNLLFRCPHLQHRESMDFPNDQPQPCVYLIHCNPGQSRGCRPWMTSRFLLLMSAIHRFCAECICRNDYCTTQLRGWSTIASRLTCAPPRLLLSTVSVERTAVVNQGG